MEENKKTDNSSTIKLKNESKLVLDKFPEQKTKSCNEEVQVQYILSKENNDKNKDNSNKENNENKENDKNKEIKKKWWKSNGEDG